VVRALIKAGCDVNMALEGVESTALLASIEKGHLGVAR
jgi:hypothetical protein